MTLIKATSHIKRGTQTLVLWMMFIIITCICYKNSNICYLPFIMFSLCHSTIKLTPGLLHSPSDELSNMLQLHFH